MKGTPATTPESSEPSSTSLVLASRGDALTPYLFRALAERFDISGQMSVDLTKRQRYTVALTTFRPSRTAWVEKFYKSSLAFGYRTANATRALADLDREFDLVFQVHALFDVPEATSVIYVDCTHHQSAEHWPAWNPLSGKELEAWYARERAEYHRAAHLFAFSEPTRRSLIDDYGVPADRVTTAWAGLNLLALPEKAAPTACPTILFVGNDFLRKGGEDLLEAFRLVRQAIPDATLRLVGTDPHLAAADGVEVLGKIEDRSLLEELYREASAFVMPSYFEPFGLAILEAMSFAVPVVASRSCGIPEVVVDGETGLLIDAGDRPALADALIRILSDQQLAARLGGAGRQRVADHFTWDAVVDRMAPVLERVNRGQQA